MDRNKTELKFFGTTACIPDKDDDTSCFMINGKYLFDTGWALCKNLKDNGIDPLEVDYLIFTHLHHDHYMALPQLLFYQLLLGKDIGKLKIVGPKEDLARVVALSLDFLQMPQNAPEIIGLSAGDTYETEDMIFETRRSLHGVSGLCYRATDKSTKKTVGITGDTAYFDGIEAFFKNCDALIHEVSLGLIDERLRFVSRGDHSAVQDAVRTAERSNSKKLFFTHHSKTGAGDFLRYAKEHYKGEALWPEIGVDYPV